MNVLLAVDGSAASYRSARFLRELAHEETLLVSVLTVVGLPKTSLNDSIDHSYRQFVAEAHEHDEQVYASIVKSLEGSNTIVNHMNKQGHVGHCIVAAAEEIDAKLIVVGARGRTNNDNVLLGSVSEYVAMHAATSVLVIRPEIEANRHRARSQLTIAFDDSTGSRAAIRQFSAFAWVKNTDVQVVSVVPIHSIHRDGMPSVDHPNSPSVLKEVAVFAEWAANQLRSNGIRTTIDIEESKQIGMKITGVANLNHSELIVLGAQGQSNVARVLLGSVAQFVLRHFDHSVWIVRDESDV